MAPRSDVAVRGLGVVVALGLALALLRPAAASTESAPSGAPVSNVPVSAEAVVLLDLETGKVLFEKNAEEDRAPASLVKMMTLYIAYDELRAGHVTRGELVTIGPNVMRTPRFRIGLATGQVVPFETLLAAVAIASANDAATAVAERLAGNEEKFVERMNAEAERLGLTHTVFANPHGLPDARQRTTARDMAALAEHLLRDFPESRVLLGDTDFVWRGRIFRRRIPLFRDPGGVTALKTGFTLEAGYNIAVAAGRAGQRLLCVVLGAETRGLSFLDAGRLLKFGFGEPPGKLGAHRPTLAGARPRRSPLAAGAAPPAVLLGLDGPPDDATLRVHVQEDQLVLVEAVASILAVVAVRVHVDDHGAPVDQHRADIRRPDLVGRAESLDRLGARAHRGEVIPGVERRLPERRQLGARAQGEAQRKDREPVQGLHAQ